jgi:PAS domain S-box-containing protein/putative nucleotidyltransferase with HDIG domain
MDVPRILIVEDDGIIARHLQMVLRKFGYQVLGMVPSGEEALSLAEKDLPDLVLMDIELDGQLDGVQTAEQFQARFQTPVVYLTAFAGEQLVQRAKLTNPFGYITKPFEERHLHATLELALQKHHYERELKANQDQLEAQVRQRTAELAQANRLLRTLLDGIPDMAWFKDVQGRFITANQTLADACQVCVDQLVGKSDFDFFPPELAESYQRDDRMVIATGQVLKIEERFKTKDGPEIWIESIKVPILNDQGAVIGAAGIARDITLRKQSHAELEELVSNRTRALEEVNNQLRSEIIERRRAQEAIRISEERYRNIYHQTPAMLHSIDEQGCLVSVSDYWLEMLGYTREEVIGRPITDFMPPEAQRYAREVMLPAFLREGVCKDVPQRVVKKTGEVLDVLLSAVREHDGAEGPLRSLSVYVDVTERIRAEQKLQMQLRRMASLRAVELSITARMDLRDTLDTLLEQVTAQLGVDAACVLLFNPRTQALEDAADSGFRTNNIKTTHLHLGEGLAGLAAVDRQMVSANNLSSRIEAQRYVPYLLSEGFVSYYGVPLMVKGVVKGVLEVYHRSLLNPPAEWLEFLDALAGQAAIAIDNKALFEEEQRAHARLVRAFDATIEGWSRAQGLRDQETEEHAQRVSSMTLELARHLGVPDNEMDHLRRGALLHDIGKMGLPDTILMNPGPLKPDEWEKMRMHPRYAFEWLSSIDFLRPALDIPYCHHERWNGSGYPRGLKGTQIPLFARIFAVIDVYDSLSSTRRYRDGMQKCEVMRYLEEQAGILFDPEIVRAFLRMISAD